MGDDVSIDAERGDGPAGPSVVCFGEVLWDSLPLGLFPGGAPFNAAFHLHQLDRSVAMVSRVGSDVLGREVRRRARWKGISTEWIQVDPGVPTGFVEVDLDAEGEPEYTIVEPAAWDRIEVATSMERAIAGADALIFGSLAQRGTTTRDALRSVWERASRAVFDVNLRPPYDDRSVVRTSLERADWVKLNVEELARLAEWFDLPSDLEEGARALSDAYDAEVVCVTLGSRGAALLREGRWVRRPGIEIQVEDAVGAGDAFLAELVDGLLAGTESRRLLDRANRLGAFVASRYGATPVHERALIESLPVSN